METEERQMTFSEAIRLGAMMKPQAHGSFSGVHRWKSNGPLGLELEIAATCAMEAGYEALGAPQQYGAILPAGAKYTYRDGTQTVLTEPVNVRDIFVPKHIFDVLSRNVRCPVCRDIADELHRVVPHLNDVHLWSRERIADWVETIEKEPPPIVMVDIEFNGATFHGRLERE